MHGEVFRLVDPDGYCYFAIAHAAAVHNGRRHLFKDAINFYLFSRQA